MNFEPLMDKEAAQTALGGIGTTKLYELLNAGHIEGVKIGRCLKIIPSSVENYVSNLPRYGSNV